MSLFFAYFPPLMVPAINVFLHQFCPVSHLLSYSSCHIVIVYCSVILAQFLNSFIKYWGYIALWWFFNTQLRISRPSVGSSSDRSVFYEIWWNSSRLGCVCILHTSYSVSDLLLSYLYLCSWEQLSAGLYQVFPWIVVFVPS